MQLPTPSEAVPSCHQSPERTALQGEERGRIRPLSPTLGATSHLCPRPLGRQGARAPPSGPRRGSCSDLPPRAPSTAPPSPATSGGRRQPSYLQPERASAPPTATASWSRTKWIRRRSDHFEGGGQGAGGGARRPGRRRFAGVPSAVLFWGVWGGCKPGLATRAQLAAGVLLSVRPSRCTWVRPSTRVLRAASSTD